MREKNDSHSPPPLKIERFASIAPDTRCPGLPDQRGGRYVFLVVLAHVLVIAAFLANQRLTTNVSARQANPSQTAIQAPEPLPNALEERFFAVLENQGNRLPALHSRTEPTHSSDIVLPRQSPEMTPQPSVPQEDEILSELEKIRQQRELAEAKERERRERELAEQRRRQEEARRKAEAEAEAERQKKAEAERQRKLAEARAEAERKRQQEERQQATARAAAEAKAKAEAEAKAAAAKKAAEIASAQAAARPARPIESPGQGTSPAAPATPNIAPARPIADMGAYARGTLYPALARNWQQPRGPEFIGLSVTVRLTVRHDGYITERKIVKSSGNTEVDQSVIHAMNRVIRVDPLPPGYSGETFSEEFSFQLD